MSNMKEAIIDLLNSTDRTGIEKVIAYLLNTDFFTAPASTKYHGAYEGGLAEHSFNVYTVLKDKAFGLYPERLTKDTVIITALLHDLCKVNFYVKGFRNVKENGVWVQKEVWEVKDNDPYGHGEKSVWILSKMIELTDQEAFLIRYHMGGFEPKDNYMSLNNALDKYPEIILLHTADLEATYMLEGRGNK